MLSVSSTLRDAINARVRRLRGLLFVDWDKNGFGAVGSIDDLSSAYSELTVERELAGDLPGEIKIVSGHVAGALTAKLSNPGRTSSGGRYDPRKTTKNYFSPYNTGSPLFGKQRRTRPVDADISFATAAAAGFESVPWFVGKTSALEYDNEPLLQALDGWGDTEIPRGLPLVIAFDNDYSTVAKHPNLYADWIVDYLFRKMGYYASPPKRSSCVFSATMHGSAFPEVGQPNWVNDAADWDPLIFEPHADPAISPNRTAKFHRALTAVGVLTYHLSYTLAGSPAISTNNGDFFRFECWTQWNNTSFDKGFAHLYNLSAGSYAEWVTIWWRQSDSRLCLSMKRSLGAGTIINVLGPVITADTTNMHYLAVQITFSSTQVSATFRYDGTTSGPFTAASASVTGEDPLTHIYLARGMTTGAVETANGNRYEAVQVSRESSLTPTNDGFVPTATLDPSWNHLLATPAHGLARVGELLAMIADAEMATIGFTETGLAYFYNRNRWTRAPATVSQRTFTTKQHIEQLPIREAVEQVRNKALATITQPEIKLTQDVWTLTKMISVPGGGTRKWRFRSHHPVANLDTSAQSGGNVAGATRYTAWTRRDGTGTQYTNLTFTILLSDVNIIDVTIFNPNGSTAYLVNTLGKPSFIIGGDMAVFEGSSDAGNDQVVESTDTAATDASEAAHGERLIELNSDGNNLFYQDEDSVLDMVDDLMLVTADPKPVLDDFKLVQGDPTLQPGDRVTIQDDETGVNADFFLTRIRGTLDRDGGFSQEVGGRGA